MAQSKSLSWNDRLAIIEYFKPTDTEIINIMGVTQDELNTARDLKGSGVMVPTPDLDFESYSKLFGGRAPAVTKPTRKTSVTSVTKTKIKTTGSAQTATKPTKVPKKRGRKGDKISIAFKIIPTTPTPADQFATDNSVSLAVLRQSKRFDTSPQLGNVRVKKDKATKTLMIWRDEPVKS